MNDLAAIGTLIERHLHSRLASFGYERADIAVRPDQEGEDRIFVVAHYGPGAPALDAAVSLAAATELNRIVGDYGDDRFVHLTHAWADEDAIDHDPPKRRAGSRGR